MNELIKKILAKLFSQSHSYPRSKAMVCGTRPNEPDSRDYKVETTGIEAPQRRVHIISKLTEVKNQGLINSCCSCALVGTYENLVLINNPEKFIELSELYHYYNVRAKVNNSFPNDKGQTIRDGCKAMLDYGNSFEYLFPYDTTQVKSTAPIATSFVSNLYKISSFHFCETISDIIAMIDNDVPVVFGLDITKSYYSLNAKNNVYYATAKESSYGGHAQKIVGYDLDNKAFFVENSWGTYWGSNGYYWLPFDVYTARGFDPVVISLDGTGYSAIKRK